MAAFCESTPLRDLQRIPNYFQEPHEVVTCCKLKTCYVQENCQQAYSLGRVEHVDGIRAYLMSLRRIVLTSAWRFAIVNFCCLSMLPSISMHCRANLKSGPKGASPLLVTLGFYACGCMRLIVRLHSTIKARTTNSCALRFLEVASLVGPRSRYVAGMYAVR
ncbi:hypothetical protein QR685DRAFT_510066 [Neurospora intermedia]|uniref:Transmembrane protein n=1 Tax=Neurospora intermedia TaxID=5142 RepID=A0ABR3DRJ2_NEUIN